MSGPLTLAIDLGDKPRSPSRGPSGLFQISGRSAAATRVAISPAVARSAVRRRRSSIGGRDRPKKV